MSAKASQSKPKTRPPESAEAPVEIKIPQRMVNLPTIPSKMLGKVVVLVLTVIALAAGWFYFFF